MRKSILLLFFALVLGLFLPTSSFAQIECACFDPTVGPDATGPSFTVTDDLDLDGALTCADAPECTACTSVTITADCGLCTSSGGGVNCGSSSSVGSGGSCAAPIELKILPIITWISCNLNRIIPILMLLATIVFLWGVVRYVLAGGNEEELKSARNLIFFGIVALAVMVAVWGFVNVLLNFILGATPIPGIPGQDVVEQAT